MPEMDAKAPDLSSESLPNALNSPGGWRSDSSKLKSLAEVNATVVRAIASPSQRPFLSWSRRSSATLVAFPRARPPPILAAEEAR